MKINILEESENKLIERKEYLLKVDFEDKTSTNDEIKELISKFLKIEPSFLIIKKIEQIYGHKRAKVKCFLYKNNEVLKLFEEINKKKKKDGKKEETKK